MIQRILCSNSKFIVHIFLKCKTIINFLLGKNIFYMFLNFLLGDATSWMSSKSFLSKIAKNADP